MPSKRKAGKKAKYGARKAFRVLRRFGFKRRIAKAGASNVGKATFKAGRMYKKRRPMRRYGKRRYGMRKFMRRRRRYR